MKISAVIATYNRRDALACCLKSLFGQDIREPFEIVIVVDGSTDGTVEMLLALQARDGLVVVEQDNCGQAVARNAGVHAATGEVVLFLDDDLICDPGLLSAHRSAHLRARESGAATAVFGKMESERSQSPNCAELWMTDNLRKYYERLDDNPEPQWPDDAWAGPNCSVPRAVFAEIGGYDEKLFPRRGEDVDLGVRLWKSGAQFRYAPGAITRHQWMKSNRDAWKDAIADGGCNVILCRKYPEMRASSPLPGLVLAPAWKRCAGRLATRWPAIAGRLARAMISIFEKPGRPQWLCRIGMRLFIRMQSIATLAGARREAGLWRNLTDMFGRRLPVLLYHHIGHPTRESEYLSLTVTPARFQRQIKWLRWRGYTAITSARWLAWLNRGEPLPKKPILLTFDDAYADIAKYALPMLTRFGFIRSVVYVISRKTGDVDDWEGLPVMTVEQLRYWAARGVEIGAHSRTHPNLTSLADDAVRDEIAGSKDDLVELGLIPQSFAYPFGCFDGRARLALEGVFPLAFTCEEGLNDLRTDPLLLRRTMVQTGDSIFDIELRAAFGWSPLNSIRSTLRIGTRFRRVLRTLRLLPR